MSGLIGVGFGEAGWTRDGVLMWSERAMLSDEGYLWVLVEKGDGFA